LTVTDANLVLGRLQAKYLPNIFGKDENEPLDNKGVKNAFENLLVQVNVYLAVNGGKTKTVEGLALGFLDVANETMCRPIRALTEAKGYRISEHDLTIFGWSGRTIRLRRSSFLSVLGAQLTGL
jgi:5-oxoprolinase (ATP-hydrolysing)